MSGVPPGMVVEERASAARVLVFGGILLILTGLLLGEIFAIFISHVASAQIRREWITLVGAAEQRDIATMSAGFDRIESLLERRGRIIDTHSHIIAFGFVALTLALLQPASKYSEKVRRWLALAIIVGGLLQSVLVFAGYYVQGWTWALSDIGGVLVLAGVLGNIFGLGNAGVPADFGAHLTRRLRSRSSRILLRSGAALILLGMAFGFYYAWVFVERHEPQQAALLDRALGSARAGDAVEARASIAAYRGLQSRIAIVTAAHSHVIEMGIMAMLLAFVQDFVLLSPRWKRRWAIVFCTGAAVMPVCIYCASMFGLASAGFADTFGMLSVVALFAMLFGLVRYTGAHEREYAP